MVVDCCTLVVCDMYIGGLFVFVVGFGFWWVWLGGGSGFAVIACCFVV